GRKLQCVFAVRLRSNAMIWATIQLATPTAQSFLWPRHWRFRRRFQGALVRFVSMHRLLSGERESGMRRWVRKNRFPPFTERCTFTMEAFMTTLAWNHSSTLEGALRNYRRSTS